MSCHQLRHTYARRLAENGMPIESLARLLGHNQLQTTQRYIDGANPALYADFAAIMGKLETTLIRDKNTNPLPPAPPVSPRHRKAPEAELEKLRQRLKDLPPWLAEALDEYITWRWPTWRAQSAYNLGRNLACLVRRVRNWLENNRRIDGWEINIMQATKEETYDACLDRAWFLILAHTGMRLSEMLDLRLGRPEPGQGARLLIYAVGSQAAIAWLI